MDSSPDPISAQSNANSTLTTAPYPSFNEVSVARLRAFLTTLLERGIYADLNLHVGYQFRPSIDQVPALPGNQSIPAKASP